jgi:site-specific recombinase XerD
MAAAKHRLRPQSYRSDQIRIKPLLEHFGDRPIDQITPARIEAWLLAKRESGVSGSTVNRYHALLSSVFSFAVRTEKLAANPARRVKRFKESDPRVRYLTDDEEAAIRKVLRWQWPEGEAELDVYLHTGLRRTELFELRWEDVDLDNGFITVKGKGGAQEFIRLNSIAKAAILKLHKSSNGSPFVSARRKDAKRKDYGRRLERCIKTAGIENFAPYHGLRHTFASRLAMESVDLRSIQDLMRHKTISMTIRYAHLSPEHQKANVERLVTRMDTKPRRKTRQVRQMVLSK